MTNEPWLSPRELRAWQTLQLMQLRLEGALARQLAAESGLSYADYVVLVALTGRPDGRMRQFELARMLGWEKSRVSHQVARMAERGLVSRERCTTDRRGSHVAVTDRGRSAIEEAAPGHAAAVRRLFVDRLSRRQLDVVAEVAEEVLRGLEAGDEDAGPPPGVVRGAGRRGAEAGR